MIWVLTVPAITSIARRLGDCEGHRGKDGGKNRVETRHFDVTGIYSRIVVYVNGSKLAKSVA